VEAIITILRIFLPVTEIPRKTIIADLRKERLASMGIGNNKPSLLKSRYLLLVTQPRLNHIYSNKKGPGLVCFKERPSRGAIDLSLAKKKSHVMRHTSHDFQPIAKHSIRQVKPHLQG